LFVPIGVNEKTNLFVFSLAGSFALFPALSAERQAACRFTDKAEEQAPVGV
jgi:hypothetical protein